MPEMEQPMAYGCLFCKTGYEDQVAHQLESEWQVTIARSVRVIKRMTTKGVKRIESVIMIPGYVFFEAPADMRYGRRSPWSLRMLKTADDSWQLTGEDRNFAEWLLRKQNGVIGLSKAHDVGDRVTIQDGPLKDLEGKIIKIDRRGMSGQVELTINGKKIRVWLGFEWIEPQRLEIGADEQ